ncbi:MAG TPA: YihY/virulence factor BrkB family protein [Gemmatimonadaceae bacterium]|nr:YihY/virulence factor BrkB family protein [Gemmatimonadaceae bacterium]
MARATAGRFVRHRMPMYAAALAYRGVLSLFPFLLLVIGVARVAGLRPVLEWLMTRAAEGDRPALQGALVQWIGAQLQAPSGGGLLSVGALTAYWSVSGGVRALGEALRAAAEVTKPPSAPAWRRLLASIAVAPVLVVMVVAAAASLLVTTRAIATVAGWLGLDAERTAGLAWLRVPAVLLLIALLIAAAYRFLPGGDQSWRGILPGAVLAAVSWTVMSLVFSVALSTVLDYGATYGSFGAAITLLVYLQLSAAVVLAGAELNAVLAARRGTRRGGAARVPTLQDPATP